MATSDIITTLVNDYFPTYSRSKMTSYLNRVQNWAYSHDCAQTTFLNGSDPEFPYPYLKTTAGTLEYKIINGNLLDSTGATITLLKGGGNIYCRRVQRIFMAVSCVSDQITSSRYYGDEIILTGSSTFWTQHSGNVSFFEVPVRIFDRTDIEEAKVIFPDDPGSTTNRYFVEFFVTPLAITAETIPLSMDSDAWYELLISGVQAIVEDVENGTATRWQEFVRYWKPRWLNGMNKGEDQWRPKQTPIRECG